MAYVIIAFTFYRQYYMTNIAAKHKIASKEIVKWRLVKYAIFIQILVGNISCPICSLNLMKSCTHLEFFYTCAGVVREALCVGDFNFFTVQDTSQVIPYLLQNERKEFVVGLHLLALHLFASCTMM